MSQDQRTPSNAELSEVISEQEQIIATQAETIARLSALVALLENDRSAE